MSKDPASRHLGRDRAFPGQRMVGKRPKSGSGFQMTVPIYLVGGNPLEREGLVGTGFVVVRPAGIVRPGKSALPSICRGEQKELESVNYSG